MRLEPTMFPLRDGRSACLRSAMPEDAAPVLDCLRTVLGETDFLLRTPEECRWTEEQERGLLGGMLEAPDRAMLVAEVDGEIAGMCGLSRMGAMKVRHRGTIDISLRKKYWGNGIATAMFQRMIGTARAMGIERLELEYVEGNERGRRLYERTGFIPFAEHPDAIRLPDGSSRKFICMARTL